MIQRIRTKRKSQLSNKWNANGKKRPRGRPAIGRLRDKQLKFWVTEQEYIKIKEYVKEHNTTVTQLILDKINKTQN